MAFKMKGSPMQRNYGISPVKNTGHGNPNEHSHKEDEPKNTSEVDEFIVGDYTNQNEQGHPQKTKTGSNGHTAAEINAAVKRWNDNR